NTAIFSRSGGSMGIGFAIPVDMARPIIDQLKDGEAVRRGFLGVVIQPLEPVFAEQFGLDADTRGVLVGGVSHDSAAAKAGVEPGDVVVGLNGQQVEDVNRFRNKVAMLGPGKPVTLEVLRGGERKTLTVTLDERPGDPRAQQAAPADGGDAFGLTVEPLTRGLARKFDLKATGGLVITEVAPGSPADQAGLKPGLRVVTVGRAPVATLRDFKRALAAGKDAVVLRVENEEGSRFVVLRKR
ncbi:MAG: PDZ domain-containing protein, partial [Myxococcales bacterium]|nr:PDZ domain-containing protein [Myxococcales bacterium]